MELLRAEREGAAKSEDLEHGGLPLSSSKPNELQQPPQVNIKSVLCRFVRLQGLIFSAASNSISVQGAYEDACSEDDQDYGIPEDGDDFRHDAEATVHIGEHAFSPHHFLAIHSKFMAELDSGVSNLSPTLLLRMIVTTIASITYLEAALISSKSGSSGVCSRRVQSSGAMVVDLALGMVFRLGALAGSQVKATSRSRTSENVTRAASLNSMLKPSSGSSSFSSSTSYTTGLSRKASSTGGSTSLHRGCLMSSAVPPISSNGSAAGRIAGKHLLPFVVLADWVILNRPDLLAFGMGRLERTVTIGALGKHDGYRSRSTGSVVVPAAVGAFRASGEAAWKQSVTLVSDIFSGENTLKSAPSSTSEASSLRLLKRVFGIIDTEPSPYSGRKSEFMTEHHELLGFLPLEACYADVQVRALHSGESVLPEGPIAVMERAFRIQR